MNTMTDMYNSCASNYHYYMLCAGIDLREAGSSCFGNNMNYHLYKALTCWMENTQ